MNPGEPPNGDYRDWWMQEKSCRQEITDQYNALKLLYTEVIDKYKDNREKIRTQRKQTVKLLNLTAQKEEIEEKCEELKTQLQEKTSQKEEIERKCEQLTLQLQEKESLIVSLRAAETAASASPSLTPTDELQRAREVIEKQKELLKLQELASEKHAKAIADLEELNRNQIAESERQNMELKQLIKLKDNQIIQNAQEIKRLRSNGLQHHKQPLIDFRGHVNNHPSSNTIMQHRGHGLYEASRPRHTRPAHEPYPHKRPRQTLFDSSYPRRDYHTVI